MVFIVRTLETEIILGNVVEWVGGGSISDVGSRSPRAGAFRKPSFVLLRVNYAFRWYVAQPQPPLPPPGVWWGEGGEAGEGEGRCRGREERC